VRSRVKVARDGGVWSEGLPRVKVMISVKISASLNTILAFPMKRLGIVSYTIDDILKRW
jgi:hypothetical protein